MKPVLRAATVAMALAVSYGMLAGTPATADQAGADGRPDLKYGKRLNSQPKLGPSTFRPEAPKNDPSIGQPRATTVKAKPYDVNGDGYADAVVGASDEDLGYDTDAGMLHVLRGSSNGVTTSGDKVIHQETYGVPGAAEDGDFFAYTNASGDFNADGFADIAVSVPGEDIGTVEESGLVQVFYGSLAGLKTSNVTSLEVPRAFLVFGYALAAGDFNGDGRDDLAVGGPFYDAGSVFVYGGMDSGLSTTYTEFMQGADIPGTPLAGEGFGESLSTGDINGDGYSDLAIGAGYDADDTGSPIGSATLLYGSTSGLNTSNNAQRFSKETPGVPGDGGSFGEDDIPDLFGYDIELADFNGDGKADLAVGSPGSPVTHDGVRRPDAGTVTVLYSNGTQIGTDNAVEITEATPNIPGIPSDYDYLGASLAGGDPNRDGRSELTTYSPGDGYVTVIPGSDVGLVTASAKAWTQDSPGIPGVDELGDGWGWSLRFVDIKNTGYQSLMVGAIGENNFRGAFTVIHSTSSGLTGVGAQGFTQDTYGVEGTAEAGDAFGAFF